MTPAPQPQHPYALQEYIITEEQAQRLESCHRDIATNGGENDAWCIMNEIRSRPAPSHEGIFFRPECPFHEYFEQYMELPERHRCHKDLSQHDTAIRNQTLDEAITHLDNKIGWLEDCVVEMENLRTVNHTMNKIEAFREVVGILEALRTPKEQP